MGDWCSEETTTEKIREAAEKLEIADCEKTRHTLARERFKVPLIGEVYSLTEGLLMGDPQIGFGIYANFWHYDR
jgi:hypothetical protein